MLKKLLKTFKSGEKGFTLIELLVVIAILGVLAAVAVPNVASLMTAADTEAALAEKATVQTAIDAFMAADGGDPSLAVAGPPPAGVLVYIRGGAASLKNNYTISAAGEILTQTDIP